MRKSMHLLGHSHIYGCTYHDARFREYNVL